MVASVVVAPGLPEPTNELDPIFPADTVNIFFDFTNWLSPGISVLSAVTKCTDLSGNDFTSRNVNGAALVLNGTLAQQSIMGAGTLIGQTYIFNCTATFSDGEEETLSAEVPIAYSFGSVA